MSAIARTRQVLFFVATSIVFGMCGQPSCARKNVRDAIRASQIMSAEQEARWSVAKKLTLRKDLDLKSRPYPLLADTDADRLQIGDVGKMEYWACDVLSVVDEQNCLLSLGGRTYWLTGYPTEGLSDGLSVRLVDPVRLQPNREYKSAGGSTKNVRCLKMLDPGDSYHWEEEQQKRQQEEIKKSKEPVPAKGNRS